MKNIYLNILRGKYKLFKLLKIKMRIEEMNYQHADIVDCNIQGTICKDAMIVFADGRMYLFQNKKSGDSPNLFNEINIAMGTNYLYSWNCGKIDNVLPVDIDITVKHSKTSLNKKDIFIDFKGNNFYIEEYYPKSNTILLSDKRGVICKMLNYMDLKMNFKSEKDYKPIDIKKLPDYYKEDLFKDMFYNKPKKNDRKSFYEQIVEANGGFVGNPNIYTKYYTNQGRIRSIRIDRRSPLPALPEGAQWVEAPEFIAMDVPALLRRAARPQPVAVNENAFLANFDMDFQANNDI